MPTLTVGFSPAVVTISTSPPASSRANSWVCHIGIPSRVNFCLPFWSFFGAGLAATDSCSRRVSRISLSPTVTSKMS